MSVLTQDNRTATTLTAENRTAVASVTQNTRVRTGRTWGSNPYTWAQETHTWANSIGNLTQDTRA